MHAHQHESVATDIAAARIDDRERVGNRDSGIDGVPAAFENVEPNLRGLALLGHHHAVPADPHRLRDRHLRARPRADGEKAESGKRGE